MTVRYQMPLATQDAAQPAGHWDSLDARDDSFAVLRTYFAAAQGRADAHADGKPDVILAAPGVDVPLAIGDDVGDNIGTLATLAVGGSVNSTINGAVGGVNDQDFYRITLQAGQSYVFSMARNGGAGIPDAYLELRDSAGAIIAEDDDGGILTDSLMMFRPTTTGTYYLAARGFVTGGVGSTGNYTLSAQAIETGSSSPTPFAANGKPFYSWTEAAYQLTREGASWAPSFGQAVTVTYSFRSTAPGTMPIDTGGFSRFNDAQIASAEAALQAWAQVANINFVRVGTGAGDAAYSNEATIIFGNYSTGAAGASAFATLPGSGNTSASSAQGDVWVNASQAGNANPVFGEFGPHVLLHEIGHALGLSHPGDYDAEEGVEITYLNDAIYHGDTRLFTVMSYFATTAVGGAWATFASTPQLHDIAAIQRLYGANTTTRTGDTVYGFNSNAGRPEFAIASAAQIAGFTIWDGGGNDTLDLSGYSQASTIDLVPETFMSAAGATYNIVIARGVVVENAIGGSGSDTIRGNAVANTLRGGGSNDSINGRGGNDFLYGGDGADQLFGDVGDDQLFGEAGNDTLEGDPGNDFIDGGDGVDQVSYQGTWTAAQIVRTSFALAVVSQTMGVDHLFNVESIRWTDRIFSSLNDVPLFRALDYMAGQDDLIPIYRTDASGAVAHYLNYGWAEGRAADNFDGLQYVAGNADLIAAFGTNQEAAVVHYLLSGFNEGRNRDGFDGFSYVAGNDDLMPFFGANQTAAAQHYITNGFAEGRALDTFDELRYVAGYDDLIAAFGLNRAAATAHYVQSGYGEGRSKFAFDPFQYIASNADLIGVFGTNGAAGTLHYIQYGNGEHRTRDSFDAAQYLANYSDLRAAFGTNQQAATLHYITSGFYEGRTDDALPGSAPLKPEDGSLPLVLVAGPEDGLKTEDAPETLPEIQTAFGLDSEPLIAGWDAARPFEARPALEILMADPGARLADGALQVLAATSWEGATGPWLESPTLEALSPDSDNDGDPAAAYGRATLAGLTLFTPDPIADLACKGLDITPEWSVVAA